MSNEITASDFAAAQVQSFIMKMDYTARRVSGTKDFKKGEIINGNYTPVPEGQPQIRYMRSITTSDGYLIPANMVDAIPSMNINKKDDVLSKSKVIVKSSAFKQGAAIGILLGAGFGYFNNKSVFYSAIIGMLIGGSVGHFMFKK